MSMDSLEQIRGKNPFQQQFLVLIHSHHSNGLELHLRSILSTKDRWQWIALKKWGTSPFQQKFLVLNHSHLSNGLELHLRSIFSTEDGWRMRAKTIPTTISCPNSIGLHLRPILSTEDGWQWKASKEWGPNPFLQQFVVLIHSHLINGLEMH